MRLTRYVCQVPILAAGCLGLVLTPGCGSRDDKTASTKVSSEMKQVQGEVEDLSHQIDATMIALNQMLTTREGSDIRPSYKEFVAAGQRVDSRADRLAKRGQDMRVHRDAYLDQWNRDIQTVKDPQIKQTQQERLHAVEQEFDQVTDRVNGIGADVSKLRANLSDLRVAFDYDLTAEGIKAMDDHIENTKKSAEEVQDSLHQVTQKLANWSTTMRPTA